MNEMKWLETQFRSWAPRRPSARLKHRIFANPERQAGNGQGGVGVWLFQLAPAAACLLAIIVSFSPGHGISNGPYRHILMGGISGSNRISYIPGLYEQEHNDLSSLTFEWTNHNGSTSSISSFSPGKVNFD